MDETRKISGDRVIWILMALLATFSLLAVYSATGSLAFIKQNGNTEFYLVKHSLIVIMGLVLMIVVHRIPYRYFAIAGHWGMYIAIPLLVITLAGDTSINEAKRWIKIPILNLTFQSSDLAKIVLLVYLAKVIHKKQEILADFKKGFLPLLWPVVMVCVLILPANFSTAAMVFVVSLFMFFIGRVPWKYLGGIILAGVLAMTLLIAVGKNFPELLPRAGEWSNRITNHFAADDRDLATKLNDPEFQQLEKAKTAIATGGFIGKMPGKSIQRHFLPSAYSDFIYAIIIEEYGLILGGFLVLMIYLILLYRGLRISVKSQTVFGTVLAFGITFSVVLQAFVNMSVAIGIVPVTGQTLPMISMGGTSIWFTCISLGMLQSIARGEKDTAPIPEGLESGEAKTEVETETIQEEEQA